MKEESAWTQSVTYRPTERIHAEHRHGDTSECSNGALICSTLQTSTIEYSTEWPYERLSSLRKVLRSMALVLKFVKLKLARQDEVLNSIPELQHISTFKPLTTIQSQDTGAAESVCIKQAQRTINSSKLQHLNISKDSNGLMRCYGRLTHSSLPLTHHQSYTIASHSQIYNFTYTRHSRKIRAYHYPDSPALPRSRATPSRVFESVGVDLAGPFLIIDKRVSAKAMGVPLYLYEHKSRTLGGIARVERRVFYKLHETIRSEAWKTTNGHIR
ncbi:hypothetical protein OSTOST_12831 [Ostertagia ostertagi]